MARATVEDNAKLLADAFSGVAHTNPRSRALGRYTNGVLESTTNSGLSGAFDWVFDPLDPLRSSVPVLNVRTEHAPGLAVIVAYNRYTRQDEVTGIDTGIAPSQFGSAAAGLNSPQKPANIPTPTTARDIIPGGVFADAGGGLNVRVGAYQHDAGFWADGGYLTLAPTATSSRKSFAVVGVDRSTNALTYTLTADRVTALTLVANGAPTSYGQTDIQAVIDADPSIDWRGAVELTNGDTAVNSAKIVPLNWIRAEMTGADGSNAGVRGLVPTPAATDNTKYLRGDGTWAAASSSFTLAGDSGSSQTISGGDTLTISGGVGLASVASATDTLTVNLDIPSLTADASPDGAADYVVTYDASASMHKKVLLDDLPGGGGGMTSFTAAGDGGTPQTIGNGNTLTIAGGLGLASTASATDTVTLDLDVNSLTEDATPDTSADYAVTYDASASTHKKVKLVNLVTSGTGSLSTVQAWTELGTTAATLSVSGISGSYDYLEVILNLRTDRASQKLDDLIVYMNSDQTAGNYRSTGHYITGGNATGVQTYRGVTVGGFAVYFGANGASATSNYFAAITMRIYNYASTVPYKTMRYDGYVDGSAALDSDIGMLNGGGIWLSTSAITGVTIKPRYGSNFVAGSAWGVYAR